MAGWSVSQDGHTARITTALGKDGAFLESFTVTEALGEPFRIACDVVCPDAYSFAEHRGTGVSLQVDGGALVKRAFHGILTEASLIERVDEGWRFQLVARPWFWVLSLGRNCRIFQQKSARDIIKQVFEDAGVASSQYSFSGLSSRGTIVREYCVQFEESDFTFVSRLMEEEGIYYYFAHTADTHVMTLCDGKSAHPDFAGGDIVVRDDLAEAQAGAVQDPHLTALARRLRPTIAEYATRDQHPKLFGDMRPASAADSDLKGSIKAKVFEYPGGFAYLTDAGQTDGADFAKLRLQADQADAFVHTGYGDTFAVPVGSAVVLDWNGETPKMLVNAAIHRFSGQRHRARDDDAPLSLAVEIDCVPFDQGWRTHRRTPKPNARGVQVATVVGTQGEEVDIDAMGRVRLQFPWDRYGQSNEKSSCWVRVSSGWAGPDLGSVFFPRIGQEVLVDFIDGDLDRPIVTGRVFDSKNVLPPKLKKTTSGIKTQTIYGKSTSDYDGAVEPPTDEPGFNEIAFEDQSGKELLYLRAQRDMATDVFRDEQTVVHRDQDEKIGRDLKLEVQTGDETHTVTKGKRTTTIKQDETLTVQSGNMATTVDTGNQTTKISKGDQSTEVSMGNISTKASLGAITVEAMQSITLKVGQNSVVIDQTGVTVKGIMIKTEASAMHQTKAPMTQVNGDGMLMLKGGITMIN